MKKKYIFLIALAGAVISYLAYHALFVHQKVTVTTLQRGNLVTVVYATGNVSADSTATLRSASGGIVTYIGAQEGRYVKRGQILLRTDDSDERLKVEQANTDLASAQVDLQNKTQNMDRTTTLLKSNSVTQKAFDDARLDADLAKINFQQRKLALDVAKEELSKTLVTAPFSGVIISASAKLGDYLLPNAVCFQIIAPTSIMVEAQVDEQDFARVKKGQKCVVAFDAYGDRRFEGYVYRIVPKTDEATKTSEVFIKLANTPSGLNVGMTTTVNIISSELHDVLLVPRTAVRQFAGSNVVYAVDGGKVHEVRVNLGATDGKLSEIFGVDIKPGTMIVSQPESELRDGMVVEVAE
jgi:membrane fusion protein (multidrug efflux system)